MTVGAALLVGVIAGWVLHSLAIKYGARLVGRDKDARLKMLDNLSFTALTNLRDATNHEINRRKGTP